MKTGRFHIIIDLSGVQSQILSDDSGLDKFLTALPPVIDMKILKGPILATGIPENPGLSGFVIIDYSHISVHTFTDNGEALVDIFSCKAYETQKAVDFTLNYFQVPVSQARIQTVNWG